MLCSLRSMMYGAGGGEAFVAADVVNYNMHYEYERINIRIL